jgi:hypothetical protein
MKICKRKFLLQGFAVLEIRSLLQEGAELFRTIFEFTFAIIDDF